MSKPLTPEEERELTALFEGRESLRLVGDWERRLREMIASGSPVEVVGQREHAPIRVAPIDDGRRMPTRRRLLTIAAALLLVALAAASFSAVQTNTVHVESADSTSASHAKSSERLNPLPVEIVGVPEAGLIKETSFSFHYETNGACSVPSFSAVQKSTGELVDSWEGSSICVPTHFLASAFGSHYEPGTTYVITVTVTGAESNGAQPAGLGTDSATFELTTADNQG